MGTRWKRKDPHQNHFCFGHKWTSPSQKARKSVSRSCRVQMSLARSWDSSQRIDGMVYVPLRSTRGTPPPTGIPHTIPGAYDSACVVRQNGRTGRERGSIYVLSFHCTENDTAYLRDRCACACRPRKRWPSNTVIETKAGAQGRTPHLGAT